MKIYLLIMGAHAIIVAMLCILHIYLHGKLSLKEIIRMIINTIFFPLLDLRIIFNLLGLFFEWRTYKELKEIYHLEEEMK